STEMTFRELLRKVRESALGAFAHQDLPFERLADELQPARSLSRSPIFQVAFALQNAPAAPLQLPGLEISLLGTETQTSKFDLSLMLTDTRRAIRGSLEYNTDLFDASTAARMLEHYRNLLEALESGIDQPISELPLMSDAERDRLLEWNGE